VKRILVVEDEPGIAFALKKDLVMEGYKVDVVGDGAEAVMRSQSQAYDLIILDIMLPSKDGFEVCREVRRGGSSVPIIMLTAKTQDVEKILGLDIGADDYVTKPYSPSELRARIRAVLRRATPDSGAEVHQFGPFEVDMVRFELRRGECTIEVTPVQLKLLFQLVRNRGHVLTRERLIEEVWGLGINVTDRVIDTHMVALRKKIEDNPASPRYLVSVRGIGYRLDS
jgi:DNA-binding response OmpR family regulator